MAEPVNDPDWYGGPTEWEVLESNYENARSRLRQQGRAVFETTLKNMNFGVGGYLGAGYHNPSEEYRVHYGGAG